MSNPRTLFHLRDPLRRCRNAIASRVSQRLGIRRRPRPYSDYIPLRVTLKAARAAGLSVSDYIEHLHPTGSRTALDQTMDGLESLGLFEGPVESVCEIGPGSGRYLERIMKHLHPRHYEIYETSREWRNWLVHQYSVTARACDGRTLAETESASMDLVHAHKVFGGLPFLTAVSYLNEMARTVRESEWVVFDVLTERCFSQERLDAWFDAGPWQWGWSPHMTARDFVVTLLATRGLQIVGSFEVPLFPGVTECMAFRKLPFRNPHSPAGTDSRPALSGAALVKGASGRTPQ